MLFSHSLPQTRNLRSRHVIVSQRSARDSNPQVLSDARFRGECISHSASAPSNNAQTCAGFGHSSMHRCPDPDNASLSMWEYVTIGVPGFEPGTSATRTQRSTGLSHTPDYSGNCIRTGWDSNPRGQCPHDFQSCALSHSATRPNQAVAKKRTTF